MNRTLVIKNSILFSSVFHLCLFGLLSFSFPPMPAADSPRLVFLGSILPAHAFVRRPGLPASRLIRRREPAAPAALRQTYRAAPQETKPASAIRLQKSFFRHDAASGPPPVQDKESVLLFHPLLPYQLQLYFKDRAAVHIELLFNIVDDDKKNYIAVKRRISSGSLDADLLCSRAISHYLFIQRSHFDRNKWQPVKIDLSTQKEE